MDFLDPDPQHCILHCSKAKMKHFSLDTQIWIQNPDPCLYKCLYSVLDLIYRYCSVRGFAPLVTDSDPTISSDTI